MSTRAKALRWRWSMQRLRIPAVILAALALPPAARAETIITTQAASADGVPLLYMQRPAQRAGLCMVDTGVDVNPDTEGVVVDRTAIDGGSGNDVSPVKHGTIMAMMAAAPENRWGMVGVAPNAIAIVSVRILEPGQTTFPFDAYAAGIDVCLQLRRIYDIRVINLSLGSPAVPASQTYEEVGNAIAEARNYGVAVVAAAGNDDSGPVEYPAAYRGVLAVGASDTQTGQWCGFSNRGAGVVLIAPGCALDGADPLTGTSDENHWQGTSEASVIASATLAALYAYDPSLSVQAAEQDLVDARHGMLDIAQSFRDAGLGQLIAEAEAAELRTTAPDLGTPSAPSAEPHAIIPSLQPSQSEPMKILVAFRKPHAWLRHMPRGFALIIAERPSEAQTQVRCLGYSGRSRRLRTLRTFTGSFERLRLLSGVREINMRYIDPFDIHRDGPWRTLRVPARRARAKARRRR